jgi:hypothetical protein
MARLNEFNVALRSWVGQSPDRMLVDLADIVSHRPDGSLCTRNGYPRTCDEYSGEETGGHLTSGWSKVRAAKAFWIAMARLAGWNPQDHQSEDVPDPPANLRIATN